MESIVTRGDTHLPAWVYYLMYHLTRPLLFSCPFLSLQIQLHIFLE